MECEIKFMKLKFCRAGAKFFLFQKNFLHNKEKSYPQLFFKKVLCLIFVCAIIVVDHSTPCERIFTQDMIQ
mgnify:CR=1 FL=1